MTPHTDAATNDAVDAQTPVADATKDSRRFKIYADDGQTVQAHGVVFPPPTCLTTVVWQNDGHVEQHHDLEALCEQHGNRLSFVDHTACGPLRPASGADD